MLRIYFATMPDRDAMLIYPGEFNRRGGFAGKSRYMGRWVRLSLTFVATLVVFAFVKSPATQASCGDYVTVRGDLQHQTDHDGGQHSKPGMPTCHGPHCQRQGPLPTVPTKALLNGPIIDAALVIEPAAGLDPTFSGWLFEHSHLLAEGHNMPPLRPPCL